MVRSSAGRVERATCGSVGQNGERGQIQMESVGLAAGGKVFKGTLKDGKYTFVNR
jgi:hypothetical protein